MIECKPYGDTFYERCPICDGDRLRSVWKVPFQKLEEKIVAQKVTVQYLPMYDSGVVYEYHCCDSCDSFFLNPYRASRKDAYASPDNTGAAAKIQKSIDKNNPGWKGYISRYQNHMKKHIPSDAKSIVDAACGGGQYLSLARDDNKFSFERLIGLELSPLSVNHLLDQGFEAYQYDLDSPEPLDDIDPGSVDFVIFSEAFEHVEFPFRSMNNLVAMLRTGGRLFFSAQQVNPLLPIRPGENQCLSKKGLQILLERLNCKQISILESACRWMAVIEK